MKDERNLLQGNLLGRKPRGSLLGKPQTGDLNWRGNLRGCPWRSPPGFIRPVANRPLKFIRPVICVYAMGSSPEISIDFFRSQNTAGSPNLQHRDDTINALVLKDLYLPALVLLLPVSTPDDRGKVF